jgi:hypothetical protein
MKTYGATYDQLVRQDDPKIKDRILKDAFALALATNMRFGITPNMCDVQTNRYTVQRIPSGKILINILSSQCGQ